MSVNPIYDYTMHGYPVRVFPFAPNWATPVNETLEWKTDVLRSKNGDEQRRQLRQVPRRGFEYNLMVSGEIASMIEAYVWSWHDKNFALPVWTDIGRITGTTDVPVLATTIPLVTATLGFRADDFAVLIENAKTFEVVEIGSVSANSLTIKSGLARSWPVGSKVYPLIVSHLSESVTLSRKNSRVVTGGVRFMTSPDIVDPNIPTLAAGSMYDGYEVVTAMPNWKDSVDNEFSRLFDTVDSGVGAVRFFQREKTSRIVRPFSWWLKSRAQIEAFRGLVGRLSGQSKSCWMPSWNDDFTIAATTLSNSNIVTVKGIWFSGMVGVDIQRDRLMITLPNGTTVYRRIVNMTPNYSTDTTQLQLDSVLGTTISVNDNSRVRFMLKCRLATDKVVIPWQTDRIATPLTSFTTVKI